MPSTFAVRPVARRRHSQSSSTSAPCSLQDRLRLIRGSSDSDDGRRIVLTSRTLAPVRNLTPSFSSVARITSDASSSPLERGRDRARTVTSDPNAAKACAISSATTPAPSTTILLGSCCRLNRFKFVVNGASLRPDTSPGTVGRPPVAITAFLKRIVGFSSSPSSLPCSTTSIVVGDVNTPRPWNVCTPTESPLSCPSTGAICARRDLIRLMTWPKSTPTSTPSSGSPLLAVSPMPNSFWLAAAFLVSRIILAHLRSALDGTQPAFRLGDERQRS